MYSCQAIHLRGNSNGLVNLHKLKVVFSGFTYIQNKEKKRGIISKDKLKEIEEHYIPHNSKGYWKNTINLIVVAFDQMTTPEMLYY